MVRDQEQAVRIVAVMQGRVHQRSLPEVEPGRRGAGQVTKPDTRGLLEGQRDREAHVALAPLPAELSYRSHRTSWTRRVWRRAWSRSAVSTLRSIRTTTLWFQLAGFGSPSSKNQRCTGVSGTGCWLVG